MGLELRWLELRWLLGEPAASVGYWVSRRPPPAAARSSTEATVLEVVLGFLRYESGAPALDSVNEGALATEERRLERVAGALRQKEASR